MENLRKDGLVRECSMRLQDRWEEDRVSRGVSRGLLKHLLGEDPFGGVVYGVVNWIVCVPGLVSFAHIVFTQSEFRWAMPRLVKLYFLSSAVMQATMTVRSSITFCIGQIQDVGLIFLAGMVKNIVQWGLHDELTRGEMLATSLVQCATSTFVVGVSLVVIGKLQWGQYVQMIPLPVVGGYLGYIGYFCLAAGLSIGSGRQISGPETLLQLGEPELQEKLYLLFGMTAIMLVFHYGVSHFLGMPFILVTLPVVFFVGTNLYGISPEECRAAGWLPPAQAEGAWGPEVFRLFEPTAVQWHYLPRQALNLLGLIIIVSFGSSLDIAAIQAEMSAQKVDYDRELATIGLGNLFSGCVGGATGSYIFSQTIFSAKRGVRSRLNGVVVCLGELILWVLPVDILQVLPNSYVGGIMCLFGIDIMLDWLVHSRTLMARSEFILVWVSFSCTMWLTSTNTFGVIEGMAVGTLFASLVFVVQYKDAHDNWKVVQGRSSVIRPPRERRHLASSYKSIFAVSLNGFAFFGASLGMVKGIEAEAEERGARFICLDLGRMSGLDSTATDQIRLLVLALERMGKQVFLSSLRAKSTRRLLEAHGVIGAEANRLVFPNLDQALQHCEEALLQKHLSPTRSKAGGEEQLETLLLDYVDGFVSNRHLAAANVEAAKELTTHFQRLDLEPDKVIFDHDDPADAIFIVAAGSVRTSSHRDWTAKLSSQALPSPTQIPITTLARQSSYDADDFVEARRSRSASIVKRTGEVTDSCDDVSERVGVGGILGDTAYFAGKKHGCDAVAEKSGCVAYYITRRTMEELELSHPALLVFLQKVLLRDLSQLLVQFLGPLQLAGGLG